MVAFAILPGANGLDSSPRRIFWQIPTVFPGFLLGCFAHRDVPYYSGTQDCFCDKINFAQDRCFDATTTPRCVHVGSELAA